MKNHILIIALLIIFCSCGALKKDKTQTEETLKIELASIDEIEKEEESNVKKIENTKVDDKDETVTKETSYEPIDATKPAYIIESDGKKTDLNNSKKTTKEITKKNNKKTDVAKTSVENHKSKEKTKSKSNKKESGKKVSEAIHLDRKSWNLLWLIIPIAIVYLAWKNKTKIIAWFNGIWWI